MSISTPDDVFARRHADWRMGAVVYQVFVDRFVPPKDLAVKRKFIKAPRTLHAWDELPKPSAPDGKTGQYPHTLAFWGGDLPGVLAKLDYIAGLKADALYLNPIFKAYSNHKYDTEDYFQIAPEFGTRKDFEALLKATHGKGMKLVLDGVFNHMGSTSEAFLDARANPNSPYRKWFSFGAKYPLGYQGWYGIASLPALRLNEKSVADYFWAKPDSVVRKYLRDGIDGWRLDVAYDMGPKVLAQIRKAAHETKPGSLVVGEIVGYPADWFGSVDGVFNAHSVNLSIQMLNGGVSGGRVGRMLEDSVADAGIENLLRSWLIVDNHDTPRMANLLPDATDRSLVRLLQFTLPGSPVVYYGSELGMTGSGDPMNRAPMRWDLATVGNADLEQTRMLTELRRKNPALRYGDFKALDTERLLGFARTTNKLAETCLVFVNPAGHEVEETTSTRVGRIMSWGRLKDALSGKEYTSINGVLTVKLGPKSAAILKPVLTGSKGYSPFDRID